MSGANAVNPEAAAALRAAEAVIGSGIAGDVAPRAPFQVQVEHLDYGYIGKCENSRELEKIYAVLKSGKEGMYPDLENFTRERLLKFKPNSNALKVTRPVQSVRDLAADERNKLLGDLGNWADSISDKDAKIKRDASNPKKNDGGNDLPPVRGQARIDTVAGQTSHAAPAQKPSSVPKKSGKSIPGGDFRAWDKYDVDAALNNVDDESKVEEVPDDEPVAKQAVDRTVVTGDGRLSHTVTRVPVDPEARLAMATAEKDKGNECFRSGDMDEATIYYTRSLSVQNIASTRNNRALVHLKQKRYLKAIEDLDMVLKTEPENIKALVRRATALKGAKRDGDAREAAKAAIRVQPNNKDARKLLSDLGTGEPTKQKKRMVIEEVGGDDDDGDNAAVPAVAPSGDREFIAAKKFTASKPGYVFKLGAEGLGYYRDGAEPKSKAAAPAKTKRIMVDEDSDESDEGEGEEDKATAAAAATKGSRRIAIEEDDDSSEEGEPAPAPTAEKKAVGKKIVIEEDSEDSDSEETAAPRKMGMKKIVISEDSEDSEDSDGAGPAVAVAELPVYSGPPVSVKVLDTKAAGNALFKTGHYVDATEHYSKALKRMGADGCTDPEMLSTLLSNRAACHLKNGDIRASVEDCDTALGLGIPDADKVAKVQLRRAAANESRERFRDAHADFRDVLSRFSGNMSAQEGMNRCARILRQLEGPKWETLPSSKTTRAAIKKPVVAARGKATVKPAAAAATTVRPPAAAATKAPAPVAAEDDEQEKMRLRVFEDLKAKGNGFFKKKKFAEAKNCYDRCVELAPKEAAAYNNRTLCYLRLGDYESAVRDADTVLKMDSANTKAMFRKGQAKAALELYLQAKSLFEQVVAAEPANPAAKKALAEVAVKLTAVQKAAEVPLNDIDAKLAEIVAAREKIEADRRRLQDEVTDAEAKVTASTTSTAGVKAELDGLEEKLNQTKGQIKTSIDDITTDVTARAELEAAIEAKAREETDKKAKTKAPTSTTAPTPTKKAPTEPSTPSPKKSASAAGTPANTPGGTKKWAALSFINALEAKSAPEKLAAELVTVKPTRVPKLLTNRLEAIHITAVFRAAEFMDSTAAFALIEALTKAKRFDMSLMFLIGDPEFTALAMAVFARFDGDLIARDRVEDIKGKFSIDVAN